MWEDPKMLTFQKQGWFLIWGEKTVFRTSHVSGSKTKKRIYQKGGFAEGFQGLCAKTLRLMEVMASICQVPVGSSGGDKRQTGLMADGQWQVGGHQRTGFSSLFSLTLQPGTSFPVPGPQFPLPKTRRLIGWLLSPLGALKICDSNEFMFLKLWFYHLHKNFNF